MTSSFVIAYKVSEKMKEYNKTGFQQRFLNYERSGEAALKGVEKSYKKLQKVTKIYKKSQKVTKSLITQFLFFLFLMSLSREYCEYFSIFSTILF